MTLIVTGCFCSLCAQHQLPTPWIVRSEQVLRVYLQSLSYSYGHEIVPPFLSAAAASYSRHSHPHLYLERTHTLTHLQPQQRSSRHWNQVPLITIIICVTITRPTHLYSLLFTVFASTFPLISLLLSLSPESLSLRAANSTLHCGCSFVVLWNHEDADDHVMICD